MGVRVDSHNEVDGGYFHGPVIQARSIGVVRFHSDVQPTEALAGLPASEGFVGRGEQLSALEQILREHPHDNADAVTICVLAGSAGVGKTALAVRAARLAVDAGWFPGGVLFVDLHGYDAQRYLGPEMALTNLVQALGVAAERTPSERGLLEVLYRSQLARLAERGRRVLIVADNAASLDQVHALRPGSAGHRMLITSRNLLPIPGARRLRLDVLSSSDAVAVMELALRAADPADDRIATDPETAAELADLCGRLPLALRIVAELLADQPEQPLEEMARLLSDGRTRLGELAYGDSPAVRAAFDASYVRLPATQARLFRLMALNPGPFVDHDAAAALLGQPDADVRRLLAALRRTHLVEPIPAVSAVRFHDLLRLYAAERCEQEETPQARDAAITRLLESYLANARAASDQITPGEHGEHHPIGRFAGPGPAQAWADSQRANLVAAATLAATTERHALTFAICQAVPYNFEPGAHFTEWVTANERAVAAARLLGNRQGEAWALNSLGNAQRSANRSDESIESHRQAQQIHRELDNQYGVGWAGVYIGNAHYRLGHLPQALASYQHALDIFEDLEFPRSQAWALANLGLAHRGLGDNEAALNAYQSALELHRQVGDRVGEGHDLSGIGRTYRCMNRLDDALAALDQALATHRETADRDGEGWTLNTLGGVHAALGHAERAADLYRQSFEAFVQEGDLHGQGWALMNLGDSLIVQKQVLDALRSYEQALEMHQHNSDAFSRGSALRGIGNALRQLGRPDEALDAYQQALIEFTQIEATEAMEQIDGEITRLRADHDKARPDPT